MGFLLVATFLAGALVSLFIASITRVDHHALGVAPVNCALDSANAGVCKLGSRLYSIAAIHWPPITWYSILGGIVFAALALIAIRALGDRSPAPDVSGASLAPGSE